MNTRGGKTGGPGEWDPRGENNETILRMERRGRGSLGEFPE
jgi:hypothetical protein